VQTTAPDGRVDFYTAEVISSREYSAYGAELPGYSYSDGGNAACNAIFVRLEGRWIALGI